MAVWRRRPDSIVHHADQGCQYTSYAFGKRCREMGVVSSMGSVGDGYDNAMAESFFATLECDSSTNARSLLRPRPAWRSSSTSKGGITRTVAIHAPATDHQSTSKEAINKPLEFQAMNRPPKRGNSSPPAASLRSHQRALPDGTTSTLAMQLITVSRHGFALGRFKWSAGRIRPIPLVFHTNRDTHPSSWQRYRARQGNLRDPA